MAEQFDPRAGRLGELLRATRENKGLRQEDIAEQVKVVRPYISLVERGRHTISAQRLEKICQALELNVAEVLGEAGYQNGRYTSAKIKKQTDYGLTLIE